MRAEAPAARGGSFQRLPVGGIVVGLLPFLLYPLRSVFYPAVQWALPLFPRSSAGWEQVGSGLFWLGLLSGMAVLVRSWTLDFPSWSLPYWMVFLLASLYLPNASMPGLTLFGYSFGRELLGPRAFLPLVIVLVVSLALRPSLRPLRALFAGLRADWTRATYAFYCLSIPLLLVVFDETRGEQAFLSLLCLLLAAGALVYLRARVERVKWLALLLPLGLAWLGAAVYLGLYWEGRLEPWMDKPASGMDSFTGTLTAGAVVIAITFLPALIAWAARLLRRRDGQPQGPGKVHSR